MLINIYSININGSPEHRQGIIKTIFIIIFINKGSNRFCNCLKEKIFLSNQIFIRLSFGNIPENT